MSQPSAFNPMFQATRRRLALWYAIVTAVLMLVIASSIYLYVRYTLIERIDDTLSHVIEVVQRSLVAPASAASSDRQASEKLNLEAKLEGSFRSNATNVEDDHIDLEWFDAAGELRWSTLSEALDLPLHLQPNGETVRVCRDRGRNVACLPASVDPDKVLVLRQVTEPIYQGAQLLGYLRVSHPWFEVTRPTEQLVRDLALGTGLAVVAVTTIGWLLSGLAMEPVQASYQRLKQFTADASHELRNPIATIQTNVQVALSDPHPDPIDQQRQLQVVERLTRRLGRLVDDLLFLARQDSGMVQPEFSAVDLVALLAEVLEEQQAAAQEQQITLEFLPAPAIALTWGDRLQLSRLLTNLVSNAVQYTPPRGKVNLEIQRLERVQGRLESGRAPVKGAHWQIQVRDNGIGIPDTALPYVFDRFYRADPARTHKTQTGQSQPTGSGLGLAIARAIVEKHQGQIQITSAAARGTTVTVWLPIVEPAKLIQETNFTQSRL